MARETPLLGPPLRRPGATTPWEPQPPGCSRGGGDVKGAGPLPWDFRSLSKLLLIDTVLDLKPQLPKFESAGGEGRQVGLANI